MFGSGWFLALGIIYLYPVSASHGARTRDGRTAFTRSG
jgi:hypothetical protein